jgi:hypothetical protein
MPCAGGELRESHRLGRGVATGAGHHEQAAGGGLDALGDHPFVLVVRERRGFARRAHGADAGGARLGLELDLFLESPGVDDAVTKRRHDGDGQTSKPLGTGGHRDDPSVHSGNQPARIRFS